MGMYWAVSKVTVQHNWTCFVWRYRLIVIIGQQWGWLMYYHLRVVTSVLVRYYCFFSLLLLNCCHIPFVDRPSSVMFSSPKKAVESRYIVKLTSTNVYYTVGTCMNCTVHLYGKTYMQDGPFRPLEEVRVWKKGPNLLCNQWSDLVGAISCMQYAVMICCA